MDTERSRRRVACGLAAVLVGAVLAAGCDNEPSKKDAGESRSTPAAVATVPDDAGKSTDAARDATPPPVAKREPSPTTKPEPPAATEDIRGVSEAPLAAPNPAASAPASADAKSSFPIPAVDISSAAPMIRIHLDAARTKARNDPEDPKLMGGLGVLYFVHGFTEAAAACFQRAVELHPQSFQWRYYSALAFKKSGNVPDAAAAFEKAIQLKGDYAPVHIELAELLSESDAARTLELYKRAMQLNPADPRAWLGLGRCAQKAGRLDEAEQHYRKAIERQPNFAEAHHALAQLLSADGRQAEAKRHLSQQAKGIGVLLLHDPLATALSRERRAAVKLVRGAIESMKRGRDKQAISILEEAVKVDASWTLARNNLGTLYVRVGRYPEAAEQFRQVLNAAPAVQQTRSLLGHALAMSGKLAEAEPLFLEVLKKTPDDAETLSRLALLMLRQARPAEAIPLFGRLIELQPGKPEQHLDLAMALALTYAFDEAAQECLQAQELIPPGPEKPLGMVERMLVLKKDLETRPGGQDGAPVLGPLDFLSLAEAALRVELPSEAGRALDQAIAGDSSLAVAYLMRADLAMDMDQIRIAVRVLEVGLKDNPDDARLSRRLAWLLATWPDTSVRDGAEAKRIAERLCAASRRRDPADLEVLAAAFAELAEFEKAAAIIQEAQKLTPPPPLAARLERHLASFRRGEPVRSSAN